MNKPDSHDYEGRLEVLIANMAPGLTMLTLKDEVMRAWGEINRLRSSMPEDALTTDPLVEAAKDFHAARCELPWNCSAMVSAANDLSNALMVYIQKRNDSLRPQKDEA